MFKKIIEDSQIPIIEKEGDGYFEVYQDAKGKEIKRIWHPQNKNMEEEFINLEEEMTPEWGEEMENGFLKFPSKENLNFSDFPTLPQDDYELVIVDYKKETRPSYNNPKKEELVVRYTLEVVALKDGSPVVDKNGNPLKGKRVFFTFRPNAMGYMEGGTVPSKSRCFLAFATGQDVDGELELEGYDALIGKKVYAEIVEYTNKKGKLVNKISRILPPPRRKINK